MQNCPKIASIKNLSKSFGQMPVLDCINLDFDRGEFVVLVGPSGCGKTTLMRALAGLDPSYSGTIDYSFASIDGRVSMAFQDSGLFPWLTLLDNIVICMSSFDCGRKEKKEIAFDYISRVNLADFAHFYPHEISSGMRQRVNIARAFVCGSEMILMDEPFVSLDFIQRRQLQGVTLNLSQNEGKTVFFITHNIREAMILADRILVMSALPGRILDEFILPRDRKRDFNSLLENNAFSSVLNSIETLLNDEILKSQQQLEQCIKQQH